MRIAVSAQGDSLESLVDPRFGRAQRFLLVDSSTMSFEVIENAQNLGLAQGAGVQAAQSVFQHKPDVVLTGSCGPNAFRALQAAGVKVITGVEGKVKDAVRAFLDGKYSAAAGPNKEGHWA